MINSVYQRHDRATRVEPFALLILDAPGFPIRVF